MKFLSKVFLLSIAVMLTNLSFAQEYYDSENDYQSQQRRVQQTAMPASRSARSTSLQGARQANSQGVARSARSASSSQSIRSPQQTTNRVSRSARSTAGAPSQIQGARSARSATAQSGTTARSARSVEGVVPANRASRSARSSSAQSATGEGVVSARSARGVRSAQSSSTTTRQTRSARGRAAVSRGTAVSQLPSSGRAAVNRGGVGRAGINSGATSVINLANLETANATTATPINYSELIPVSAVKTAGKSAEEVAILLGNEKSCKEQYIKCMDPLCSVPEENDESKVGRCLCSASIVAQSGKEKELNKISANINQMQWQTKNLDTAKAKADLEGRAFHETLEEVTEEALRELGVTDARSASDEDIFEVFLGEVSEKTVRKEGNAKLKEANKACAMALEVCPDSKKQIQDAYSILAGNDCRVYSKELEKKIFENKIVLQNAYNQYQMKGNEYNIKTKNKYNSQECATELTKCMRSGDICGTDYEFCKTDEDTESKKVLCQSVLNKCEQANNPPLAKGQRRSDENTDVLWKSFKKNAITQSADIEAKKQVAEAKKLAKEAEEKAKLASASGGGVIISGGSSSGYTGGGYSSGGSTPSIPSTPTPTSVEPLVNQAKVDCEGSTGKWEKEACLCGDTMKLVGTKCTALTDEEKCTNNSGTWEAVSLKCVCPKGKKMDDAGKCSVEVSQKEIACLESLGTWANEICTCEEGKIPDETTGICTAKIVEIDPLETECVQNKFGLWDVQTSTCGCPEGKTADNLGICKDIKEIACLTSSGTWNPATTNEDGVVVNASCSCGIDKELDETGKCIQAQIVTACITGAGTWDSANQSCMCPTGSTMVGTQCTSSNANAPTTQNLCAYKRGVWSNGLCRCPAGLTMDERGLCKIASDFIACPAGYMVIKGKCTYMDNRCPNELYNAEGSYSESVKECNLKQYNSGNYIIELSHCLFSACGNAGYPNCKNNFQFQSKREICAGVLSKSDYPDLTWDPYGKELVLNYFYTPAECKALVLSKLDCANKAECKTGADFKQKALDIATNSQTGCDYLSDGNNDTAEQDNLWNEVSKELLYTITEKECVQEGHYFNNDKQAPLCVKHVDYDACVGENSIAGKWDQAIKRCICNQNGTELKNKVCAFTDQRSTCVADKGVWDTSRGTCCPQGSIITATGCQERNEVKMCRTGEYTGTWNFTSIPEKCDCQSGFVISSTGQCTPTEAYSQCPKTGRWENGSCNCGYGYTKDGTTGICVKKTEVNNCESSSGTWNYSKETNEDNCSCQAGYYANSNTSYSCKLQ